MSSGREKHSHASIDPIVVGQRIGLPPILTVEFIYYWVGMGRLDREWVRLLRSDWTWRSMFFRGADHQEVAERLSRPFAAVSRNVGATRPSNGGYRFMQFAFARTPLLSQLPCRPAQQRFSPRLLPKRAAEDHYRGAHTAPWWRPE